MDEFQKMSTVTNCVTMSLVPVLLITIGVLQTTWGSALRSNNVGVFGGIFISIKDAPYMALLKNNQPNLCGAIIINQNYVLTVATCCQERNPSYWTVITATNGLRGGIKTPVQSYIPYPEPGLKPNICLVKLATPLKWSRLVAPIALDDGYAFLEENTPVKFTAFGKPDPNQMSGLLQQATLTIDGSDWCKKDAQRMNNSIICAGNQDKNTCYGDNGGALTYNGVLVGVLSTSPPDCHSFASRFSKINYYRQWILDNSY